MCHLLLTDHLQLIPAACFQMPLSGLQRLHFHTLERTQYRDILQAIFPFFLTGTKATPSSAAMIGPKRNPRESKPTTQSTSPFIALAFSLLNSIKCIKAVVSRIAENKSLKSIPFLGKS